MFPHYNDFTMNRMFAVDLPTDLQEKISQRFQFHAIVEEAVARLTLPALNFHEILHKAETSWDSALANRFNIHRQHHSPFFCE